jgi:ABC-type branched-subunit amino acid transport system substrate-binding protein
LVADPDILGVIGHFTAETTSSALPVYQQANLALVIPWSVGESIFVNDLPGVVSVAATVDETSARLDEVSEVLGFPRLQPVVGANLPPNNNTLRLATDAVTAGNIILSLDKPVPLFGQVEVGNRQLVQVAGPAADGLIFVSPGPGADDIEGNESFKVAYQTLAGFPPGPRSILAYDATHILLDSIEQAMIINSQPWPNEPSRPEIVITLTTIRRQGLTGNIEFASNGQRLDAPVWVYQISEARYPGTPFVP